MGGLEGPDESANKGIVAGWFWLSLFQAASGGDLDVGKAAAKRIDQIPVEAVQPTELGAMHLAATIVYMYENQWEKAERIYKKVHREHALRINIRSELIGMIIAYEMFEAALARRRAYKLFARLKKEKVSPETTAFFSYLEERFLYWCSSGFLSPSENGRE